MKAALFYSQEAVKYDKDNKYEDAIHSYLEASQIMFKLIQSGKIDNSFKAIATQYIDRAEVLKKELKSNEMTNYTTDLLHAENLLKQAIEMDKKGSLIEARDLYITTIEFCLECCKTNKQNNEKLRQLASDAIEKAEFIKNKQNSNFSKNFIPENEIPQLSLHNNFNSNQSLNLLYNEENIKKKQDPLTEIELKVLAFSSKINNKSYVPFMNYDLKERFSYDVHFLDKDGLLLLSNKQQKLLDKWKRPHQFTDSPTVISRIDSSTIKQTIVSDCSFIASLAVLANYENNFGKRIVANIIYPQNKNGIAIYNPSGKYMIRLHINGIWRKIIIDDLLPIGKNNELLCSYSKNQNELWVSLLEKAYMKVMGGYDFPGSNSGIDLNALTGWIPERISIKKDSPDFQFDKVFERLFSRFHKGDCLITLATGSLSDLDQKRTGLVDSHAYALLDIRKINNKRLFLLKNPWTHLRWKGSYSANDTKSWTPELCTALNYNLKNAAKNDDGVFWIDFESICAFFDVFYVNWNPKLFPFSYVLHSFWDAGLGPVKDLYTISDNPQYSFEINNLHDKASVWILLTRHITEKDDFADNKEYITVIVYKSGERIYFPHDVKPIIDGTRINSPHYLCKLMITEPGVQKYTFVIAQYEKSKTIYYTLRVYSSQEFKCSTIKNPYKFHKKKVGEWRGKIASDFNNANKTSHIDSINDPIYHIILDDFSDDNSILIELRGPKEYSIAFEITQISTFRNTKNLFKRQDSGPYRRGYTMLQIQSVPAGTYAVRPMTILLEQKGAFILSVNSSCNFTIKDIQ